MKLTKSIFAAALAACVLCTPSCKYDDSEIYDKVDDLEQRVEALETLTAQTNATLASVKTIVDAINAGDYITNVSAITGGYKITFAKKGDVEIYNGKTPAISVKLDATDGFYYWTLDGELMLDANGKKIRANGTTGDKGEAGADAVAPQVRINAETNLWEISTDGGTTWTPTTTKATGEDGDAFFQSVDLTNATYVTFTLADGQTFKVDRSSALYQMTWIVEKNEKSFWDGNTFTFPNSETFEFAVTLTTTDGQYISADNYGGIKATIESRSTTLSDVTTETRGVNRDNWTIKVNGPILYDDNTIDIASVFVTPPAGVESETAVLTLTFYDKKGNSISKSCLLKFGFPVIELTEAGTLDSVIVAKEMTYATSLTIKGKMDQRDFEFIKTQMPVLFGLNMADVDIVAYGEYPANTIPEKGLGDYDILPEHALRTVVLPRSATAIGNSAFAMCTNLQWIHFPEGSRMKTIGRWIGEFSGLVEITIPASVTTLEASAFYGTMNLERINFEAGSKLTEIPDYCFYNSSIETITLPATVTNIGWYAFVVRETNYPAGSQLTYIDAPGVKTIGSYALGNCRKLATAKFGTAVTSFDASAFQALTFDWDGNVTSYGEVLAPQCDLYIPASQIPTSGTTWMRASWKSIQEY